MLRKKKEEDARREEEQEKLRKEERVNDWFSQFFSTENQGSSWQAN